jgi:hypothetical protein
MKVTMNIPDALSSRLPDSGDRLPETILEGFAVEAYRSGSLSLAEVRMLLGHENRWQTEDFLASRNAWPALEPEDVESDGVDGRGGIYTSP